jgi:hypothetical protein
MSFMFPPTIRGWFTELRSRPGRDGIHIPVFGMAGHISTSAVVSELASSEATDGAGLVGDSTGTTTIQFTTAVGITRGAARSTTGIVSIAGRALAVVWGRGTETSAVAAECTTVRVEPPDRLKEIIGLRVDTPRPTARAASVRGLSADTIMAERPGPFLRAGAPVWAEEELAAAVATIANETSVPYRNPGNVKDGEKVICGERS